jgi:superfamily II DNA or RNA helicase
MGYLPVEPHHHPAILSLVTPATPAVKLLDPFAGDGLFLEVAAQAWNVTPYANELDGERAQVCIERFGPTQAVRCDVERLLASNNAFGAAWLNPPYDHDKIAKANKRVEFAYLRHSWKWLQDGGLALWCIYSQHITEDAAAFLAKNSSSVDVWALPGKHQGEYDQVVIAAVKGIQPNPGVLYQSILDGKAHPRLLTIQLEPLYKLPAPPHITRFVFAPDVIDEEQGLRLIQEQGAWKTNGFQTLLEVPRPPEQIEPVVAPRPGHMALVLAAGVANGAVIETSDYGRVAIRGKTQHVEQIARVEIEAAPGDPERQVKKTTIRLKPTTTLTLLAQDGTVVEMDGDEALLGFITANKRSLTGYLNQKFKPMYSFDLNGMGRWLDRIRLKGKYPMYTAQKHVTAAVTRGFQSRDSILLVGQMGTGKTLMGGSTAIAMAAGVVEKLRGQIQDDQVVLIVAPPHLIEKWKRELHSISRNIYVERLDRHEDVRAFMEKSTRLGPGIAKIGLIKRDMTKLGAGREVGVVWRNEHVALWQHNQSVPEGYDPQQRLVKQRVPKCPTCGCTVMQEKKGTEAPASESWLKGSKRTCSVCQTPLWQEARDKGSQPKPGQKYPTKNPRYRIDEYLKRVYPDRVYLLIWDEVHECAHGDTGNGEAFNRIAGLAHKVLAMTGTPFNGRSSSIFNLEYALNPRTHQRYNWGGAPRLSRKTRGERGFQTIVADDSKQRGRAESRWVADMGVREQVVEERPSYDKETGAFTGTSTYERPFEEAPGISPLLVAEVLDHAIFFSLGDLGKVLPQYEEIALPVAMDADTYEQYDRTRQQLKDYLIGRRWEGDTTFRGAYLQWAMGWPNAAHRPHEVIHNLKHPITGEKLPHIVTSIPSYGEDRVYAKEQALIDLVRSELEQNRPCVIYIRQTATRDIQPRIEALIRQHVPAAKTFILKNTVEAERREAVIEGEVAKGTNVVISNPELVKTGLDLVFAPTLIFYEIVFNLGTMMQAAGRSYRLNQTHTHCKTYYLFCEGTMEQTAVQLMSRKQRAAKLLTGDVGLTGLDALTEGEGGFEEALLEAIGRDEALLDPSDLFKKSEAQGDIDTEDAAYWNVELTEPKVEPLAAEAVQTALVDTFHDDPLIQEAIRLGGVVSEIETEQPELKGTATVLPDHEPQWFAQSITSYLDGVHLIADDSQRAKLQAKLLLILANGVQADDGTYSVVGMCDPDFNQYPVHEETLMRHVRSWLKEHRFVFAGCEAEVAANIVRLAKQALNSGAANSIELRPIAVSTQSRKPAASKSRKRQPDLLAVPDEVQDIQHKRQRHEQHDETAPLQLALF